MRILILCAGRGQGKTTCLGRLAAAAAARGWSVGGIASPAVGEPGARAGYDLVDLATGVRQPLARVAAGLGASPTVGPFWFDEDAVRAGNAAVVRAVREGRAWVAIDEIGLLELRGGGWAEALRTALSQCAASQRLIVTVRPSLVTEVPRHFPSPHWDSAERLQPPWPDGDEYVSALP